MFSYEVTRGSHESVIAHLDQSCFQYQRNCTVAAILVGERDCRTQFWKKNNLMCKEIFKGINTVNRYIGKSIIVRKPITRCYLGITFSVSGAFTEAKLKSYLQKMPPLKEYHHYLTI
jgi:hypothetical protein